jgi:hypothetical protein
MLAARAAEPCPTQTFSSLLACFPVGSRASPIEFGRPKPANCITIFHYEQQHKEPARPDSYLCQTRRPPRLARLRALHFSTRISGDFSNSKLETARECLCG